MSLDPTSFDPAGGATAEASAPASSANLGPGFDCLAVALDLRCRVTVESTAEWELISAGAAEKIGESNVVVAATKAAGIDGPGFGDARRRHGRC